MRTLDNCDLLEGDIYYKIVLEEGKYIVKNDRIVLMKDIDPTNFYYYYTSARDEANHKTLKKIKDSF